MCRSRKLTSSSPRLLKLSMVFLSLREQEKLKIPFRRMNSSYFILNETNQKGKTCYSATLKTNTTFLQLLDTFIGNLRLSVPLDITFNNSAWSSDSTSRCGSDCGEKKNKILDYSSAWRGEVNKVPLPGLPRNCSKSWITNQCRLTTKSSRSIYSTVSLHFVWLFWSLPCMN